MPLPPLDFAIKDLWARTGLSKEVKEQEKELNDAKKEGSLETGDASLPE